MRNLLRFTFILSLFHNESRLFSNQKNENKSEEKMSVNENLVSKSSLNASTLFRLCGVAAVLSGLITVFVPFSEYFGNISLEWMYVLNALLTLFALIGIYGVQVEGSGYWGLTGFIFASIGNAFLIGSEQLVAGFEAVIFGSSILSLGLILLAIGTFKSKAFPRWIPILWIAAPLVGIPSMISAGMATVVVALAGILFGVAFIGAGYYLWTGSSQD
jgi:hypothetical protein